MCDGIANRAQYNLEKNSSKRKEKKQYRFLNGCTVNHLPPSSCTGHKSYGTSSTLDIKMHGRKVAGHRDLGKFGILPSNASLVLQ